MLSHLGPLLVLFGIYGVILWMALAYWALRDARARSDSPGFHLFAMGVNLLVPMLGLLVYLLVRPGMTLVEERALEMEAQALSQTGEDAVEGHPCPACGREIERDFILCPYCHTRFAKRCPSCQKSVRLGWTLCPYCATSLELSAIPMAARQG